MRRHFSVQFKNFAVGKAFVPPPKKSAS